MSGRDGMYMRDSDAFSWYMEADPLLRSTVVSVVVLDHQPDVDSLFDKVDRACRVTPGFRHKVVQAPMRLANPRWVEDDAFELGFHVRRIAAAAPGRLVDVLDYACQTGMAGFDRERALWEFTLVEGLEGGRAALVLKVHHALTDGIGGMEMAKSLFDLDPDPPQLDPMPPAHAGAPMSRMELVRDALAHNVSRVANFTRGPDTRGSRRCRARLPESGGGARTQLRRGSLHRAHRATNRYDALAA